MHGTGNFSEKDDPSTKTEVHDAETDTIIPESTPGDMSLREKRSSVSVGRVLGADGRRSYDGRQKGMGQGNAEAETDTIDDATRRNSLSETPPRIDSEETEAELGRHTSPKALEAGFANDKVDDDVIIVDWEGPDDPCNPKKCVISLRNPWRSKVNLSFILLFKLVFQEEMGSYGHRLRLYVHLARVLVDGGTRD